MTSVLTLLGVPPLLPLFVVISHRCCCLSPLLSRLFSLSSIYLSPSSSTYLSSSSSSLPLLHFHCFPPSASSLQHSKPLLWKEWGCILILTWFARSEWGFPSYRSLCQHWAPLIVIWSVCVQGCRYTHARFVLHSGGGFQSRHFHYGGVGVGQWDEKREEMEKTNHDFHRGSFLRRTAWAPTLWVAHRVVLSLIPPRRLRLRQPTSL